MLNSKKPFDFYDGIVIFLFSFFFPLIQAEQKTQDFQSENEAALKFTLKKPPDVTDFPYNIEDVEKCPQLGIEKLNEWDYEIFELARVSGNFVLSQVSFNGVFFA